MKNTLFEFWKQKEIEWGRTIPVMEVADAIGTSRDTITRLRKGTTTRYDAPVISKVCQFFDVPAGPIPFLVYVPDETGLEKTN